MAANSGSPEGASFSWGEMWTLLNWLCIEFLANRGLLISGVFFNFRSANFTITWLKSPLSKTINRKWHF